MQHKLAALKSDLTTKHRVSEGNDQLVKPSKAKDILFLLVGAGYAWYYVVLCLAAVMNVRVWGLALLVFASIVHTAVSLVKGFRSVLRA